jgi:hypothetical protein
VTPPNRLEVVSVSKVQQSQYLQWIVVAVTFIAPMSHPPDRIQLLGKQFESLTLKLAEAQSPEERTKLLRQMKVLIVEIDMVILSSLRRDDQDSTNAVLHG